MNESSGHVPTPSSSRGRQRLSKILNAATDLFLRDGYGATSIDSILELAGGSKATLYNYFPTKDDLFRAVIDDVLSTAEKTTLESEQDVRAALTAFFSRRLTGLFSDRHHALLRLIIAERGRFPDLARMYYEHGPLRTRRILAEYFRDLEQRGLMPEGFAEEASDYLLGAMVHWWVIEVLLLGGSPTQEEIESRARRVVDRFVTAFQRAAAADPGGGPPGIAWRGVAVAEGSGGVATVPTALTSAPHRVRPATCHAACRRMPESRRSRHRDRAESGGPPWRLPAAHARSEHCALSARRTQGRSP